MDSNGTSDRPTSKASEARAGIDPDLKRFIDHVVVPALLEQLTQSPASGPVVVRAPEALEHDLA
jgi:hypothetical protein